MAWPDLKPNAHAIQLLSNAQRLGGAFLGKKKCKIRGAEPARLFSSRYKIVITATTLQTTTMVATAAAGGKTRLNSVYGREDTSERREGRDDVPEYSDIERSKYHAISSPRSDWGDVALGKRRLKDPSIPAEERCEAYMKQLSKDSPSPSIRRSKASNIKTDDTSIACGISKAVPQNDIVNLGKEFELGFESFDRRSKHSTTNSTSSNKSSDNTREPSSAKSLRHKIAGSSRRSNKSAASDMY